MRFSRSMLEGGIHSLLRSSTIRLPTYEPGGCHLFAIVPNTTHYTLAVEPILSEIVERFLGTK